MVLPAARDDRSKQRLTRPKDKYVTMLLIFVEKVASFRDQVQKFMRPLGTNAQL